MSLAAESQTKTYYRDASGAIINKSDDDYKRILASREQSKRIRDAIEANKELKMRLNAVETEITILRDQVTRLIERYNV